MLELRQLGKTIFLSSHILTELSDVCTSVGILEQGRLVVAGPIGRIAERLAGSRAQRSGFSPRRSTQVATTAGGAPIPSSTRRRLKLRILGDAHAVVPLLSGGGGIESIEPGASGLILITYVGDERFVAEVVRHLVANGVGVVGVEPERNELERIFLEVTRGTCSERADRYRLVAPSPCVGARHAAAQADLRTAVQRPEPGMDARNAPGGEAVSHAGDSSHPRPRW